MYVIYTFAGNTVKVWIVGSSIVKNAFITSRQRPGGVNLGLDRLGVSVWWQGLSGMSIKRLKQQIKTMMRFEDPPEFLILHIAGNDIGNTMVGYLRNELKQILRWVAQMLPNTVLVWSQILPRIEWRYSKNTEAMGKSRYRINNSIASFVLRMGGCYIRYPDIRPNNKFIASDRVHLTNFGNEVFLNTIQGSIEHFLRYPNGSTFPV